MYMYDIYIYRDICLLGSKNLEPRLEEGKAFYPAEEAESLMGPPTLV